MKTYRIIRFYRDVPGPGECIADGLSLAEAQAYCNGPGSRGNGPTGPWFDGYTVNEEPLA
jgi:hypothetical protein